MGTKPSIDITVEQRATILALLNRHLPNTKAWAYGSRAKWTSRPQSDLDLVVFATPDQSGQVFDLREALEESNLPFRVDLFVWEDVPESFRPEIEKEHVVLARVSSATREFRTARLGDCIVMNKARYSPKEAWPFINYLDTGSISDNRVDGFQYLIPGRDQLPSRARRKADLGDIIYSTVRPNQRHFGLLRNVPENLLVSTGFAVFRGQEGIANTGFIYWFLTQNHVVEQLHTIAENSTSTYPSIRPADIANWGIPLPPLPEQRAIAHILGTLDDKIELNQKMNQTLEEIAKAIFKSWFVDFDPVRAKAEGRPTGLPPEISDLFPDELVESEIGEIPKGWEIGSLRAVGGNRSKSVKPEQMTNFLSYVGLEHLPRGHIFLSTWGNPSDVESNKTVFEQGDILFGKLRPYFEKSVIAPLSGVCSTDIVAIEPNANAQIFIACLVSQNRFFEFTSQGSTGTRMPRTSWKHMCEFNFALPPHQLLESFQSMMLPLVERAMVGISEYKTLSELRDTLLPKLISGDIRLRDAERWVEEAA